MGVKRGGPDAAGMQKAISDFLHAAGVSGKPDVARTPERVTRMWLESLIDGEGKSPRDAFPRPLSTKSRDLIAMRDISVHSVCPHHLLPVEITASIAFVPHGYSAGFSRVADFVEACAHRLVLLEELAVLIVDGLSAGLNVAGAACVLDSRHGCMLFQGKPRHSARVKAVAFRGVLESDEKRRAEALRLLR